MALGSNVSAGFDATPVRGKLAISAQIRSQWVQTIDNSGLSTQDASAITDPDAEINNSTTHIFVSGGRGSALLFRMKYLDDLSAITDPVLKVFGRHSGSDTMWMTLFTSASTPLILMTMVTASTDDSDGTDNWTAVTKDNEVNMQGCDEFLVGVQTVLAATGNQTLSTLEVKVI